MEFLQSPLAPALYLGALALTGWGAAGRKSIPSFLGGLLWAGGTVCALVDGAGLDVVLAAALALLLLSAAPRRGGRSHEL